VRAAGADSTVGTRDSSAGDVADSAAAAAPTDTLKRGSAGVLAPGRNKHDAESFAAAIRKGESKLASWPKGPAPAAGALLPGKRIIAYYGNPHSKKMGVIGEYPEQQMLGMLDRTVAQWKAADPQTPIVPAIHLVAVVAQGAPGPDGMWRRREGAQMIEKTYGWAKSKNGVLFLDIQASHSTLQKELPQLLPYLERPDVHLGVDPEFYMHHDKEGVRPSAKIGQMRASDINYVINTLDRLVTEKRIPPKVLVVHRFTRLMVPDAQQIRPTKNVQVVMHMDGWGPPWLKFDSYHHYIVNEPVQFTGFKLFYHNDTKKGDALLTPKELLQLKPTLSYIQYQ
jgi:glycosyltransferase involved in cell wall biosynthesis